MHTVRLMQEVFKGTGNRPTGYIYENVVMAKADAKLISAELGHRSWPAPGTSAG